MAALFVAAMLAAAGRDFALVGKTAAIDCECYSLHENLGTVPKAVIRFDHF
jgi:hypothetical protein